MSLKKRLKLHNAHLSKDQVALKYNALTESSFRFYRGTCHLFAEDFFKSYTQKGRVKTWICGDAHIENFGSYKSDDRNIYFDLNDFDEAILGFPELELTRFLTSVIIAASVFRKPDFQLNKLVGDLLNRYSETILSRKQKVVTELSTGTELMHFFMEMTSVNRGEFIEERTSKKDGIFRIKTDGIKYTDLSERDKLKLYEQLIPALSSESRFSKMIFEDAAARIAGTASLGLKRYGLLFFFSKKGKRYLVDVKQARASCYEPFIDFRQPLFNNIASRITNIGNLCQFAPPAFVNSECINNQWFVVRELQPSADRISLKYFLNDYNLFTRTTLIMADIIASAHLRGSGNWTADSADKLVRFTEKDQWRKDILDLSGSLAAKNEKYFSTFLVDRK